ncbi:glycosyltransferase family 2 protein [Marinobacter xiaoshiensis]|uniref:Glycosyltransferase family 2 protein n=1 Tax=Marinobacter xiaoshiensis TaxID=3073652 RepID=A0ABU2HHZ2_9GAMM|nr:glycosyltransferase family 2 protein [Marinobacter sp. F60267]MDS1309930.1 glycosyltransferase family 2 protein [Marinobacter sp. F60267]
MKESISVAIPVFNRAGWIGKTLEHIFSQSVPVDEVILCDDGSTDDLEQAIQIYRDKIKVIRIENSGPAIARKVAIENSSGDWIALCDSDDFWNADHIENFLNALGQFPQSDLYFSNFLASDRQCQTKFECAPEGWFERLTGSVWLESTLYYRTQRPFLGALLEYQACFPSCLIFRRDLYQKIGGIKEYVSRWASEDLHLTARMASITAGIVSTRQSVIINKHNENFSGEHIKNVEGEILILDDLLTNNLVSEALFKIVEEKHEILKRNLFRLYFWSSQFESATKLSRSISLKSLSIKDLLRLVISYLRYGLNL